jgi:hypothetical protein
MTKRLGILGAMVVPAVIGLTACGGDDNAKTSATAAQQQHLSSTATAKPTDTASEPTDTPEATKTAPAQATEPTSGEAGHACDLLTTGEVSNALGEALNEPDRGETIDTPIAGGVTAAVSTCGWTTQSFASSISMTYYAAPGRDDAISGMIGLACTNKQAVDVGADSACWYDAQEVQIQAAKGGSFVDMFATMSGDASNVLHDLMSKAISRVP